MAETAGGFGSRQPARAPSRGNTQSLALQASCKTQQHLRLGLYLIE